MLLRPTRCVIYCFCCLLVTMSCSLAFAQSATQLPVAQLISPEELVKILRSHGPKPLIFNVGPRLMYEQGHIPGAAYYGPGSDPAGLKALHEHAQTLPRNSFVVLYCGCCPWVYCPNVNPAYQELSRMGFTNVKVLKIDNNFGADWVEKGYPTVRG